ncbi:MAG: hypothetical protein ACI97N_001408 [Cognaticolwellia sp.]|jgi:hypothetical protein
MRKHYKNEVTSDWKFIKIEFYFLFGKELRSRQPQVDSL